MFAKAERGYRILATGVCFSVFGLGGLLLSLLIFPVQRLLISDADRRMAVARYSVHRSFRLFIRLMQAVGVLKLELPDAQSLAAAPGKILIANHPTLIDVVALIALIPSADCVVKSQLFRNPFIRGVIRSTGYIANSDPEGLLQDCAASLARGNTLIIFPEGTRSTPGQPIRLQRGAANIALRSDRNFLVCLLRCQPSTLSKHEAWYQVPASQAHLKIRVLHEWDTEPYRRSASLASASRLLTRDLELFFNQVTQHNGTTESRT